MQKIGNEISLMKESKIKRIWNRTQKVQNQNLLEEERQRKNT